MIEILSLSNEAKTRANVRACATIASVREVLILSTTSVRAEVLRQGDETPVIVAGDEALRLYSIDREDSLVDFYATTDLT